MNDARDSRSHHLAGRKCSKRHRKTDNSPQRASFKKSLEEKQETTPVKKHRELLRITTLR